MPGCLRSVDPRLLAELRRLADSGLGYAELWRRLRPRAAELDVPRPSYPTVCRLVAAERRRLARRARARDELLAKVLAGRIPLP